MAQPRVLILRAPGANCDEETAYAFERAGAILHTTISAFKGLESDVLILADIDPEDSRCDRNARYVAASRAKSRLYVFGRLA